MRGNDGLGGSSNIGYLATLTNNPQQGNRTASRGTTRGFANNTQPRAATGGGNTAGYMGVDGKYYRPGVQGYGVIRSAEEMERNTGFPGRAGQEATFTVPGASPLDQLAGMQFGKSLADYLPQMGSLPQFNKSLQDYLNMGQYSVKEWAKEQLAAHDAINNKFEHRGKIGEQAIGQIYDQLGQNIGDRGAKSIEMAQGQISAAEQRGDETLAAMQDIRNSARTNDDDLRAKILGGAVTGVSNSQQGADRDGVVQSEIQNANQNSDINLMRNNMAANQKFIDSNVTGAGYAGAEAQNALRADVNDRISTNETNRLNTIANAKNEARQAAIGHFSSDYGQFSDNRSAAMQQQQQAYQRALDQYNADYGQFNDNLNSQRGFEEAGYNRAQYDANLSRELATQQQKMGMESITNGGDAVLYSTLSNAGLQDGTIKAVMMINGMATANNSAKNSPAISDANWWTEQMKDQGIPAAEQYVILQNLPSILQAYK